MNKIIIVIYVTFLAGVVSCNQSVKLPEPSESYKDTVDKPVTVAGSDNFVTEIKLAEEDSIINKMPSNKLFVHLANKYYNTITDTSLIENLNIDEKQTVLIEDFGTATIAEIKVEGKSLSNAVPKKGYLLYDKSKSEVFFFNFDRLLLIKKQLSDTAYIIAGIPITKGVGYFLVYVFSDDIFKKIFDSGMDIDDSALAVPVYLNEGGCIQYSNNFLKFENTDINNDGFLDLSFVGNVIHYCNPNEYNVDLSKRKPIKQEKIKVNYVFEGSKKLTRWVLLDSSKVESYLE